MSACNILIKRKSVHILTDGLSYNSDGVVQGISQKCYAIPTLHAAVSAIGAGAADLIFWHSFSKMFASFDELVSDLEHRIHEIYDQRRELLEQSEFSDCELYIAGWSAARRRPEAYMMRIHSPESQAYWDKSAIGTGYSSEAFKLQQLDGVVANPGVEVDDLVAAGLSFDCAADQISEAMSADIDMLHLIEVQRRRKVPLRPGRDAHYWVGGVALLTSIDATGISQRVLHRWGEDRVGSVVTPEPIDWRPWRAAWSGSPAAAIPHGLSRLQRERMEKKARKGTLRVAQ